MKLNVISNDKIWYKEPNIYINLHTYIKRFVCFVKNSMKKKKTFLLENWDISY